MPFGDEKGGNRPDVLNHYPDHEDLWFVVACVAIGAVALIIIFAFSSRDSSPYPRAGSGAASETPIVSAMTRPDPASPLTIYVRSSDPVTVDTPEPRRSIPIPSRWSCTDVAEAMRAQGFSEDALAIGPGVVMAESGGRANALAVTPHERSVGPWQVNRLAHPAYSDGCLRSLACSTAAAYRISHGGTNWRPWAGFTSGAYLGQCE